MGNLCKPFSCRGKRKPKSKHPNVHSYNEYYTAMPVIKEEEEEYDRVYKQYFGESGIKKPRDF